MSPLTRKLFFSLMLLIGGSCAAQSNNLVDINGDGLVVVLGFGDSITFGVGDDTPQGQYVEHSALTDGTRGYLSRISSIGGLATLNSGRSGEFLSVEGIERLPSVLASSNADVVIFMEGMNDSSIELSQNAYSILAQKAINIIRASGRLPVVMTNAVPCCNRLDRVSSVQAYNSEITDLATINSISLIDNQRAWSNTCVNKTECELFNIPDGIHPNTLGYDVMGQNALGTLFGVDLFQPNGAAELEAALGASAGTIIVKPDPEPAQ